MFKCEHCNQQMPPKTPSQLFVTKIRRKIYPAIYEKLEKYSDGSQKKRCIDRGGVGFETVQEIRVCPDCHDALTHNYDVSIVS